MLSMKPTPIHTDQNRSRHLYFAQLLEQEMVRIRVAAEELQKLDPPPRSRTAPILADKERTPVTLGKRARSESVEPTRSSKRLRGIATQLIVVEEDDDVVVLPGGWATGGKNPDSTKRDFTRTISTQTSSTVFDQETRTPTSLSPDKETHATAAAPISQDAPTNTQFSTSTMDTDPDMSLQMSPISPKPLYSNIPPLPVLIDGHPSLRVVFRELCLYRFTAPSPIHEWQSHRFFSHITDPAVRAEQEETQTRDGVVFIPDTLFESSPETDPIILDLVHEFLEHYSLPNQAIHRFNIFTDPIANILEPRRISWWKLLADHFRIPHNLDKVFNTTPGNWHFAYHNLPTFEGLRELSELAENLGFKRGREMVHQEIARRIAFIKGKGDRKAQTLFRLLKKGYEELREMSKEYDHRCEERFDGQTAMDSCIMCRVRPVY
jgi:hypothetical protein